MNQSQLHQGIILSFFGESCELLPATDRLPVSPQKPLRGLLPGKFRTAPEPEDLKSGGPVLPVAGDLVLYRQIDEDSVLIEEVLPRRTVLSRKTAGDSYSSQIVGVNVDFLWIVMPADRPVSKGGLLRYRLLADSVSCGLIVHKCDLVSPEEIQKLINAGREVFPEGMPVIQTTAADPSSIAQVTDPVRSAEELPQDGPGVFILAMTGPSGAGKTTLLNALLGTQMQTGEVSSATGKGKHTTVRRDLILTQSGYALLDTPGMRELGLDGSGSGLAGGAFEQIEMLASGCSFSDCTHTNEPGCLVTGAVEGGKLDADTLHRYRTLKSEADQVREFQQTRKKKKFRNVEKEAKMHRKEQWQKDITLKIRNSKKKRPD